VGRTSVVSSNQRTIHRQLHDLVLKHQRFPYRRPLAPFSRAQFDRIDQIVRAAECPLILDSGCGVGESTRALARMFPTRVVIGIDKSHTRIERGKSGEHLPNLQLLRGDCVDFWRLAAEAKWPIERHYLLYPNPWPKAKHLQRRWHGHPVFGSLVTLGGVLELRSNWEIYVAEFAAALKIVTDQLATVERLIPREPLTPFERKYSASEHPLFRLRFNPD
jgi:tRNA (guanine-N7-)-methyltransferase